MNYHTNERSAAFETTFMTRVFSIMGVGLALTAIVSLVTMNIPELLNFAVSYRTFLFIAEIGIVIYLASRVTKMPPQTALLWFLGYAALNGLTLTPFVLIFAKATVASAFFISSAMFGGMALWGATTKKDLSSIGSIAFMGLFGIIIASIVNIFLRSSGMQMIISYVGVAVFTGLTAYDVQKLKRLAHSNHSIGGLAIMGALTLYLDFINLFIMTLSILGGNRR